jgi:hypothetical protein
MNAPVSENISAAKAGGLIVLVLAGWLAYQTLSGPAVPPPASSKEIIPPPSSLVRAGLRDYTDWEGLPEIFAVWADKAQWKNGRTRFAYWHPVMKTYSYYFEAVQVDGGYRFKEIAEPHDSADSVGWWDESLGGDCPIRFYHWLDSDPWPRVGLSPWQQVRERGILGSRSSNHPQVQLDIAPSKTPRPDANVPPQNSASKP